MSMIKYSSPLGLPTHKHPSPPQTLGHYWLTYEGLQLRFVGFVFNFSLSVFYIYYFLESLAVFLFPFHVVCFLYHYSTCPSLHMLRMNSPFCFFQFLLSYFCDAFLTFSMSHVSH